IYAVSAAKRCAYSVNFARLHLHRPGYGYAGVADPWAHEPHPKDDGLHGLDLESGRHELLLSLDQLARIGTGAPGDAFQWLNHVQVSPDGERVAFFHIHRVGADGWRARLFVCGSDGSDAICLLDADVVSHYDWFDANSLLIWAKDRSAPGRFWRIDASTG